MDFFRSVFSGEEEAVQEAGAPSDGNHGGAESNSSSLGGEGSAWGGFGSLIKTLASKSESVIQTYQRDLQEFGSGFRVEAAAIREVIKDLPNALEAGASVAQESLESVGQVIDDLGDSVWRGATDVIAHSKDAILSIDSDFAEHAGSSLGASTQSPVIDSGGTTKKYNRFEVKVMSLQSNPGTFTEGPEDAEDFGMWAADFQLGEKEEEIESLLAENEALEVNLEKLVPVHLDYETFWTRYFYKVYKLKQVEDVRADLVKRVLVEEEEELSWEVDDDDYEEDGKEEQQGRQEGSEKQEQRNEQVRAEEISPSPLSKEENDQMQKPVSRDSPNVNSQVSNSGEVASVSSGDDNASKTNNVASKLDDQILHKAEAKPVVSVPNQPSAPDEDDLGWDEIEDLGEDDDKKISDSGGNLNDAALRKRLSTTEEEEDLSWDIEDDEPIKD
ncbi:unnamed protein product [Spirodela intermedia]|uniref:BSD domain-containing protein n=1 Tax=Spirodela intermedia TaxID=51605 RepID=A0A7I8IVW2_SPIIN|nr:unnamed protein product [Spirodela intermedia]CAA6662137.1 unnamed protein product [Spirodela intermedia]